MMNFNNDVYQAIKKMTLEEFVKIINGYNEMKLNSENIDKEYQVNKNICLELNIKEYQVNNDKILYTIDELIEKYPFFTRYNINKAIQKNGLPCFTIGNKRLFNKDEIEKWLDKESKLKKDNTKYEI